MSFGTSLTSWTSGSNAALAVAGSPRDARTAKAVATALNAWIGGEFSVLDGLTGELLWLADAHSRSDWTLRAELCREVARRDQVEFIEEDDPVIVVAVPLAGPKDNRFVAGGGFLSRAAGSAPDNERILALVGGDARRSANWAAPQTQM